MNLEDLVGKHLLDAVNFDNIKYNSDDYDDSSTCVFRLDGQCYMAIENPSDGYRSSLRELIDLPSTHSPSNIFPAVEVTVTYRKDYGYRECELLEFISTETGKIVLTVGTINTDDYYPSFVANFVPEHMPVNTPSKKMQKSRKDPKKVVDIVDTLKYDLPKMLDYISELEEENSRLVTKIGMIQKILEDNEIPNEVLLDKVN